MTQAGLVGAFSHIGHSAEHRIGLPVPWVHCRHSAPWYDEFGQHDIVSVAFLSSTASCCCIELARQHLPSISSQGFCALLFERWFDSDIIGTPETAMFVMELPRYCSMGLLFFSTLSSQRIARIENRARQWHFIRAELPSNLYSRALRNFIWTPSWPFVMKLVGALWATEADCFSGLHFDFKVEQACSAAARATSSPPSSWAPLLRAVALRFLHPTRRHLFPYNRTYDVDIVISRSSLVSLFIAYYRPSHITWATPTCLSSTIRERGTCTRSLPRRHGRRRNRSAPQVPLSLRHRLLLLRFDGQYIHQVSPVDSGGRQSSIARTPSPRVSLRRICFRACVCRFFNYAIS